MQAKQPLMRHMNEYRQHCPIASERQSAALTHSLGEAEFSITPV